MDVFFFIFCSIILFRFTIIKSITDLERIGDEAEKIGRYAAEASESLDTNLTLALRHLCEHVKVMLRDTLDAFARVDDARAMQVAETDLQIDREFEAIYRQLITLMMEDPRNIKQSLSVVWCARALERIGDHCCNIARSSVTSQTKVIQPDII